MGSPVDGFAAHSTSPYPRLTASVPLWVKPSGSFSHPFECSAGGAWRWFAWSSVNSRAGVAAGLANGISTTHRTSKAATAPLPSAIKSGAIFSLVAVGFFAGAALLVAFVVLWIYVASVYRFVLFDSVLYDRCELKGSWRRWERFGRSYLLLVDRSRRGLWIADALIVGVPIALAWRAGIIPPSG